MSTARFHAKFAIIFESLFCPFFAFRSEFFHKIRVAETRLDEHWRRISKFWRWKNCLYLLLYLCSPRSMTRWIVAGSIPPVIFSKIVPRLTISVFLIGRTQTQILSLFRTWSPKFSKVLRRVKRDESLCSGVEIGISESEREEIFPFGG